MSRVFLGGSCDPTTWRRDVAMPALDAAGITYYNPQVTDWKPELVEIEARAKEEADTLLFVVDGQTRAIASMLEAAECICDNREVVLVINDIPDGTEIAGQEVTVRELKDLNRARVYLADIAKRHGVLVFATVAEAVEEIVDS